MAVTLLVAGNLCCTLPRGDLDVELIRESLMEAHDLCAINSEQCLKKNKWLRLHKKRSTLDCGVKVEFPCLSHPLTS